jgi:hypothetical protein
MKHIRFGDIRCLSSTKTIYKGQEIYEDYSYDDGDGNLPRWYLEAKNEYKKSKADPDHPNDPNPTVS